MAIITSIGCGSSQLQQLDFEVKTVAVGKGAASVEAADLNHDQLPDIAVANSEDSSVSILLNQGHRTFLAAPGSPFYAGHFPNDIHFLIF